MTLRLVTEHYFGFLNIKGGAQARQSLDLSKCHIVGNHMSRLKYRFTRIPNKKDFLPGPPGFTCWISFAPLFSFIY